jgi:hypothetical protein
MPFRRVVRSVSCAFSILFDIGISVFSCFHPYPQVPVSVITFLDFLISSFFLHSLASFDQFLILDLDSSCRPDYPLSFLPSLGIRFPLLSISPLILHRPHALKSFTFILSVSVPSCGVAVLNCHFVNSSVITAGRLSFLNDVRSSLRQTSISSNRYFRLAFP